MNESFVLKRRKLQRYAMHHVVAMTLRILFVKVRKLKRKRTTFEEAKEKLKKQKLTLQP